MTKLVPLLSALALTACAPQLFSTPATYVVASPSSTLEEGNHAVEVLGIGSRHSSVDVWGIEGHYRYGLIDGMELEARATLLHAPEQRVNALTGVNFTVGSKLELGTPHLAVSLHAGAGTSGIGSHVGADLGLHLSYDNPYVVPFLNGRVGFSSPFERERISIEDGQGETASHQTRFTYVWTGSTGARFKSEWFSAVPLYFDVALSVGRVHSMDSELNDAGAPVSNTRKLDGFIAVAVLAGYEL